MGEQNRRAVEVEARATGPKQGPRKSPLNAGDGPDRALSPEADERQTRRQAPEGASPGESADGDSIG